MRTSIAQEIGNGRTLIDLEGKYFFRQRGDKWQIRFGGKETWIRDLAGMHYIRFLIVNRPGSFTALEVETRANQPEDLGIAPATRLNQTEREGMAAGRTFQRGDAEYNKKHLAALQAKEQELETKLEAARADGDIDGIDELDEQVEMIRGELKKLGYAGHLGQKDQDDPNDDARVRVWKSITYNALHQFRIS